MLTNEILGVIIASPKVSTLFVQIRRTIQHFDWFGTVLPLGSLLILHSLWISQKDEFVKKEEMLGNARS